jgi:hypothetical protein
MEFGRRYFWREPSAGMASAGNKATTDCVEAKIAASEVANEFVGHGTQVKSKSRPFKTERVGHLATLTSHSALTNCGGVIQPCALADRKDAKGRATRVYALWTEEQSHFPW